MDWNIIPSISHLLILVGGVIGLYVAVKSDLTGLKKDVRRLEDAFKQLGSVLTQVAVQDQRLYMIEKAIDELRHGKGFVEEGD